MEEEAEPVTPIGRFFVQEEVNQVILGVIGLQNPIDIESIKAEITNSIVQHPNFLSVLVRNKNGREYWDRTQNINLDDHIFLIPDAELPGNNICSDDEIVNAYVANLTVSSPLSTYKPLWEVHILREKKCLVFRIHHALGDGISIVSMLLASCRKIDQPDQLASIPVFTKNSNRSGLGSVWKLVMMIWLSFVYALDLILRGLCFKRDAKTKISGGSGVEMWPRKLVTAKFKLDDMKSVKNAVPNATINDVLFGVISAGLSRYLDYHHQPSDSKPQEGLRITGVGMVNLREQPGLQDMSESVKSKSVSSWWGNKFGLLLLPIYHHKNVDNDPLEYVKRAKAMLDKKKLSLEVQISFALSKFVMSFLGPKVAVWYSNRVLCNTSFTISNVVGPQEEIMIRGNPVTSMSTTSTSFPHALTMHMVSYAGKVEMQILVAKDIIPDPQFLAKCFEDALLEMKDVSTSFMQDQLVTEPGIQY